MPESVPPPPPRHAYVRAASLFLIGVGLLIWFFRGSETVPVSIPPQQIASAPKDPSFTPSKNSETTISQEPALLSQAQEKIQTLESTIAEYERLSQETIKPEVLTQAQEKIQTLEFTIAEYQRLSKEELQNVHDQRTQLEAQLQSKEATLAELHTDIQNLNESLLDQQHTSQTSSVRFRIGLREIGRCINLRHKPAKRSSTGSQSPANSPAQEIFSCPVRKSKNCWQTKNNWKLN